jgi:hypothetical protein
MALIFIWQPIPATGTPVGIIVFLALACLGTVLLRRQTAEEFPDALPRFADRRRPDVERSRTGGPTRLLPDSRWFQLR